MAQQWEASVADWTAIARSARARAATTRSSIFGSADVLMPISETVDAATAAPGFIGPNYGPGGVLILSINPAGGKDNRVSGPDDKRMYAAFRTLAAASDELLVPAFHDLNRLILAQMPGWRVFNQHTSPVLDALDVRLEQVAYVYVVPFRTRDDQGAKIPSDVVDRAYRTGLADQLSVLNPGVIIAIDRHSERVARQFSASKAKPPEVRYYTRKRDAHAERAAILADLRLWSARRSS